jgi:hypothetical protein
MCAIGPKIDSRGALPSRSVRGILPQPEHTIPLFNTTCHTGLQSGGNDGSPLSRQRSARFGSSTALGQDLIGSFLELWKGFSS